MLWWILAIYVLGWFVMTVVTSHLNDDRLVEEYIASSLGSLMWPIVVPALIAKVGRDAVMRAKGE